MFGRRARYTRRTLSKHTSDRGVLETARLGTAESVNIHPPRSPLEQNRKGPRRERERVRLLSFREEVAPRRAESRYLKVVKKATLVNKYFRGARNLDGVLRIPIHGHFSQSAGLHRFASHAL